MRLLLDTHAFLWYLRDDPQLRPDVASAIANPANEVFVSIVSLWEISIKSRIGKLQADIGAVIDAVAATGFTLLDIRPAHLIAQHRLPIFPDHRDPFDHLLIAQGTAEELTLVTRDRHAPRYGIPLLSCT
jgi:PIN domain nuclease of toxin-antitoxin system